jgi:fibro-slime domain-containing protein
MKLKYSIVALTTLTVGASALALDPLRTNSVVVRDFSSRPITTYYNPNFQSPVSGLETGIVATDLPGTKVPTFTGPGSSPGPSSVTTAADFAEWWSPTVDGAPNNAPFNIDLVSTLIASADVKDLGITACCGTVGIYNLDYTPFFPIDGAGSGGGVPSQATGGYYGNEGRNHNFGFTLQYNTTFTYIPGANFLSFEGDDDLWVFVNNKLVLDLGGVHPPLAGGFVLDENTTDVDGNLLNLEECQEYDIDFYYAERHNPNSNLELTFTVFEEAPCVPESKAMVPSLALAAGMALMAIRRRRSAA